MTATWGVATPHQAASDEAAAVLAAGGNAVDAALAAAITLTVVYPNQCSVGGDVVALVGTPDGRIFAIDGSGRSPIATGDHPELSAMPVYGPLTVTVPGAVAAWSHVAAQWGTRPAAAAFQRAAELSADGVPVAPGLARDLRDEENRLLADPGMRDVFTRGGKALTAGEALIQPRLAETLRQLAQSGPEAFYAGAAQSIVSTLRDLGSPMTEDDFASHRTWIGEPISTSYAGVEYVTGPPACQGAFFLEGLAALARIREELGRELDANGADATRVANVLYAAACDRDAMLGDRDTAPIDIDALLKDRAERIARSVLAGEPVGTPSAGISGTGDTVAVVTADASGGWVSLIQSNFHAFGSGILDPESGVVLHNRGSSFSLRPDSPNRFAGGRRPAHTLMPVLVRRGESLIGAHGTMGGRAQPQIHAQIALQLAAGATPEAAVGNPRWILGAMGSGSTDSELIVRIEQDVPAAGRDSLMSAFAVESLPPHDDDAGHAQLVRNTAGGVSAATDPRADGSASVG